MQLSLSRFDASQLATLQMPSELGGPSFNASLSEMPEISMQPPAQLPGSPDQMISPVELPAAVSGSSLLDHGASEPRLSSPCTSDQHFDVDGPYRTSSAEPSELSGNNNELHSQARQRTWDFDWAVFESPSQRPASVDQGSVSDVPDLSQDAPRLSQAPEAATEPNIMTRQSTDVASEHIIPAVASCTQLQRPSAITFYCNIITSCKRYCSCVCHSRTSYNSPQRLKNLLGSLFVGYTGLPSSTLKCDLDTCANQGSRNLQFQASYTFPVWFVMKTLYFSAENSFVGGPSFGLRIRNRINQNSGINVISLARTGDIPGIIQLLEKGKASLYDISITGVSPFRVRHYSTRAREGQRPTLRPILRLR